jgi:UDP-N-acetylmuramate--alanine ligase
MHIYFSGIGGTAIGPLALIARQCGYTVSGSDKQASLYIDYLQKHGISDVHIGQSRDKIATIHQKNPIDWFVYSSAITKENADHPELAYAKSAGIHTSKRDELLNKIIEDKGLKLIAVAGTHGKTTTTAMVIWLFKQLGIPISYSVGAKISFGDMGQYQDGSEYFVYECDEFDRNFLAFSPYLSLITGVTWDHHEIFPTQDSYNEAFREFIGKSKFVSLWRREQKHLDLPEKDNFSVLDEFEAETNGLTLAGQFNRQDAWLAVQAVHELTHEPINKLVGVINNFPGTQRRMERIIPDLYSDYAHTPEKIGGAMSVALEMASKNAQKLVVVYEPLTNRRQHFMKEQYGDVFSGASKVYWVPSYLAREDPDQAVLSPQELITHLADPSIAQAAELNEELRQQIAQHLKAGDMVVAMSGGGGDSLDEWLRANFKEA